MAPSSTNAPLIPSNILLRKAVKDYIAHGEDSLAHAMYGPIAEWDVSCITDMSGLFALLSGFTVDLSKWDVSNVTNMGGMFHGATKFTSNLSKWNVGNVTNMGGMFHGATKFTSNLSKWNVGNVTNMGGMFHFAEAFTSDLSQWDVSNVTNMCDMFYNAEAFTSDLSEWDVGNVTGMCCMFRGATTFTSDLSKWDVGKVANMSRFMFKRAVAFHPPLLPAPGGRGWTAESLAKHRAHWRWTRLRSLFRVARPIVNEWLRSVMETSCAEGGAGRKRDRAAFEAEFGGY